MGPAREAWENAQNPRKNLNNDWRVFFPDARDHRRFIHTLADMIGARVFAIVGR